jgi:hypothetical protein
MEQEVCGAWMPRAKDHCALLLPHPPGQHRTAKSIADSRKRKQAARREGLADTPLAVQRWNRTYRLKQYGLTEEDFARMLEAQDYACAMCPHPFEDGETIYIDHDHTLGCHPGEKSACDRCRRGLLCRECNTALGHIERRGELARAYLATTKTPRPQGSGVSGGRAN